jgi:hemoglobin
MPNRTKTTMTGAGALAIAALCAGCAEAPPTIAHTHIGHAVTGVHVTPNNEGYMALAERRAQAAVVAAERANGAETASARTDVSQAVRACDSEEEFGLKQSVILAANHVSFAATSLDASLNLQQRAPEFAKDIARVVERCELIKLLSDDLRAAATTQEMRVLTNEILTLARANLGGDDSDGDGVAGSTPREFGVRQLRASVEALVSSEDPPYMPVDEWHLYNLVRLPGGRWVYDQFGRGGNINGYTTEEGEDTSSGAAYGPRSWVPIEVGAADRASPPGSLYARIGGDAAMIAIIDEVTRLIEADDRINFTFADANLNEFKKLLFEQLCELAGGPCVYTGRTMYESHKHLDINNAHFNALAEDLYLALDSVGIPYKVQNEFMEMLAPMQRDMVFKGPAEPSPSAPGQAAPSSSSAARR